MDYNFVSLEYQSFSIPIVVVGNKLDLQFNARRVTTEEGKHLAASWNAAFLETSAKDNTVSSSFIQSINHLVTQSFDWQLASFRFMQETECVRWTGKTIKFEVSEHLSGFFLLLKSLGGIDYLGSFFLMFPQSEDCHATEGLVWWLKPFKCIILREEAF